MATLKLAVVPAKVAKDGTHKIRIAISHKQKTSYFCIVKGYLQSVFSAIYLIGFKR